MDKLKQYLIKILQFIFAVNINPLLFMVLFSWSFLLDMLERNGQLMVPIDMLSLFIYGSIILLLQYVIVKKTKPYCKHVNIYYGIITLLFVVNLLGFYLLNYGKYLQASLFWQIMLVLIVAGLFYLVIKYSEKWVFFITLSLAYSLFFVSAVLGGTQILDKIGTADVSLPENYKAQDFIKKPNIYLLSFDSMMPQNVVQKLLDLQPSELPEYFNILQQNNAVMVPNAFTYLPTTYGAFSSLLALDIEWYRSLYGQNLNYGGEMITGARWTPTYDVFDHNGYDLQMIFGSDFFRSPLRFKDKKVDYWYKTSGEGFCSHIDLAYSLWGYCIIKSVFAKYINANNNIDNIYHDRFQAAAESEKPTFTLSYTYSPGHTGASHNGNDLEQVNQYKEKFSSNSIKAAKSLQSYIDIIRADDKDGIIIIFADHGAKITRGIDADNIPADSPYSKADIIQDGHAVLMAVLDPHANTPAGCQIAEPVVTTLPDMMYNLITCLTGGKPVLKQRHNSEADFIDYLYDPVSVQ
ncbi:MAG: hypothetical protein K0U39_03880 [Alphaproteobacteria bacterium]|nr:hypothetical protein [Alphaproteobacteria bacterium]